MRRRVRRRLFPLIVTIGMAVSGTIYTTLGADLAGQRKWGLPYDLWGTLLAASRLAHGDIGGLYAAGTGLISLPGAAVILAPCAAVISAAGLSLQIPGLANPHPPVWLVAGPYQIALCGVTLFAADALAERLGVSRPMRTVLTLISAVALWSVSTLWGHPEDAVAVGLLLYAVLAQSMAREALAGWLVGAAVCVQPLVLLALPALLALLPWRRMPAFLIRSALPSVVSLGVVALANWHDTYVAVTSQPNSPVINHPTIWTALAPHMAHSNVAAGPFRLATILLACCCGLALRHRWVKRAGVPADGALSAGALSAGVLSAGVLSAENPGAGDPADGSWWPTLLLAEVLWWIALTLALRSFFEPVMVSYYPWPPIAVALIPAATLNWVRMAGAGVLASGLTLLSQGPSHDVWIWWLPLVIGLILLLAVSRRYRFEQRGRASVSYPATT